MEMFEKPIPIQLCCVADDVGDGKKNDEKNDYSQFAYSYLKPKIYAHAEY